MTQDPEMRRMRLRLDKHQSDLLVVGTRFEPGDRYVSIEVPWADSACWSWLQWDQYFDQLEAEWRRRNAPLPAIWTCPPDLNPDGPNSTSPTERE